MESQWLNLEAKVKAVFIFNRNCTWILKSPPRETLWDSSEKKSPAEKVPAAAPSSMTWRSFPSRSEATAAKSNSEKKGPCRTVLTQWTAQRLASWTSWYKIPPLLGRSMADRDSNQNPNLLKNPWRYIYICGAMRKSLPSSNYKGKQKKEMGRDGKLEIKYLHPPPSLSFYIKWLF